MTPEEEKRYFRAFRKLAPELFGGKVLEFKEKESWPDVVYQTKQKSKIAVELTELLYKKNIDKAKVRGQNRLENYLLKNLIQKLQQNKIFQSFFISILMDYKNPIKNNKEALDIANYIADFLFEKTNNHQFNTFERLTFETNNLKKHKIDKINIFHSNKITKLTGNIGSSGILINNIEYDEISAIINKKDTKIKNEILYAEKWLVIIETEKAATWRENISELSQTQFKSKYDKIFIFRYLQQEIISLKK